MSSPRSFLGLRRLSRGSPGVAKTAQEGSKRAARRQKMGPGDLQDGLGGFVGIPTWPERPQEWRKMLQESSQRRQEEAETAKSSKIPRVFEGFWLPQIFGGACHAEGFGGVRDGPGGHQGVAKGTPEGSKRLRKLLRRVSGEVLNGAWRPPEVSRAKACLS